MPMWAFAIGMLALVAVIIGVPLTLRAIIRWFWWPPRRRHNGFPR